MWNVRSQFWPEALKVLHNELSNLDFNDPKRVFTLIWKQDQELDQEIDGKMK
jgi:hypothetical protein